MPFDVRDLARFQADFLDRITAKDAPKNLRVFHDTWFHGLLNGLQSVYPATMQAFGEPAFNAYARDYIRAHPLCGGNQTLYGGDFPAFLQIHPQAGPLAWLSDLARLEWAEHLAHHSIDAEPCGFEDLLDPQAHIAFHPSVQSVRLTCNAEAFRDDAASFDLQHVETHWLIGRDRDDDVIRLRLVPVEADFLAGLIETGSLIVMLERFSPDADALSQLQICLARLVQAGFLIQSAN